MSEPNYLHIIMDKLIFSDQWEKDAPLREESLKFMREHPLTSKELSEQVRRNQEIRKKSMAMKPNEVPFLDVENTTKKKEK